MPKIASRTTQKASEWLDVICNVRPGEHNPQVICRYCGAEWFSTAVLRIQKHMGACQKLPEERRSQYSPGGEPAQQQERQGKLNRAEFIMSSIHQKEADRLLAEAVYSSGIPFNFVSFMVVLRSENSRIIG